MYAYVRLKTTIKLIKHERAEIEWCNLANFTTNHSETFKWYVIELILQFAY